MNKQGLLLCAKYSVAPNYFGYCGPNENKSLVDHLEEKLADKEVRSILSEFESLYLNLTLIAKENRIDDVFDEHVVEAYWLGNQLLQQISSKDYSYFLDEKFLLVKKLGSNKQKKLIHKLNSHKVYPHHSFHVFNVFKRTGHDPSFHTLKTMDECRIGWGKIIRIKNLKLRMKTTEKFIYVEMRPLEIINDKLQFGKQTLKKIHLNYHNTYLFSNLKAGEWISFHWSHICDIISFQQVKNLEWYTQKAIDFYNT